MIGTMIKKLLLYTVCIFLVVIITMTISNAVVVGYGMLTGADDVDCNLLYCTLTYTETETMQKCYMDNI